MAEVPHTPSRFGSRDMSHDLMTYHRLNGFRAPIWSLHPDDWQSLVNEYSASNPVMVMYNHDDMAGLRFQDCIVVQASVPQYQPQP